MNTRLRLAAVLLALCVLAPAWIGCAQRSVTIDAPAPMVVTETEGKPSPGEDNAEGAFAFPADRGGAMLDELLAPSEKGRRRMDIAGEPRRSPRSQVLQEPSSPLAFTDAVRPRPVLEKPLSPQRPAALPEPLPFVDLLAAPRLPEPQVLPAAARIRVPSPDVNRPIPLPILGEQVTDRASLDDPTIEASASLALALSPPLRATPAPFIRFSLPNPFEHREAGQLSRESEEVPMPVAATPLTPNKP